MVRLTAFLIVVSLSAPSMAAVVCAWSCHAEHAPESTAAAGGCHERNRPADVPAVSAAHSCHDPGTLPDAVIAPVRSNDDAPAVIQTVEPLTAAHAIARAASHASGVPRPPGTARLVLPLRI